MTSPDELVFVPLGGLGEIGMNAALYGFGPPRAAQVDPGRLRHRLCRRGGAAGRRPDVPGHPLHRGASARTSSASSSPMPMRTISARSAELWPRLRAPVYATRFALGLLEARRLGEPGAPKVELREVAPGPAHRGRAVRRSSTCRSPIRSRNRTRSRSARRSASSSIPATGSSTTRLSSATPPRRRCSARLGDEGVLALVCDSTNVVREGRSPSESEVAKRLAEIIAASPAPRRGHDLRLERRAHPRRRASRRRPAAARSSRSGAPWTGSSRSRANAAISTACPSSARPTPTATCRATRSCALITGSQGEPRAALARIADDEHPEIALSTGDRVIFSSRTIPGNEKAIGRIVNTLVRQRDRGHHRPARPRPRLRPSAPRRARRDVSLDAAADRRAGAWRGHPPGRARRLRAGRRACPRSCAPATAPSCGSRRGRPRSSTTCRSGASTRTATSPSMSTERAVPERRKLSFAGIVSVAIAHRPARRGRRRPGDRHHGRARQGPARRSRSPTSSPTPSARCSTACRKARRRDPEAVEDAVAPGGALGGQQRLGQEARLPCAGGRGMSPHQKER